MNILKDINNNPLTIGKCYKIIGQYVKQTIKINDNTYLGELNEIIGEYIIDLFELESLDLLNINRSVLAEKDLNAFIALGKTITNGVRNKLIEILCDENSVLRTDKKLFDVIFKKQSSVKMLMPVSVGDYTDFYSSIDHATNIGTMI